MTTGLPPALNANGTEYRTQGWSARAPALPPVFPFTAIVGQERMKLALLLNAVHPALGGVLIFGEKGSAKSTAVRALTALLPEIEVVRGCLYNCDPTDPEPCEDCASRRSIGPLIDRVRRRVPLVELPVGASPDSVLGRLDVEYTTRTGLRRFEAGLLARAHRGILYADEVNLLGNNLVDILLDAAAMGQNYVERDGISVAHPASFALIGTMNPQEGQLRPQLLDRFALVVEVQRLPDPVQRAQVVHRRMAYEADPEAFLAAWAPAEAELRRQITEARERVASVAVADEIVDLITRICAAYDVDGLRADLAIYRASVARVAFEGRDAVTPADVRAAAELALPHRRHREPVEQHDLDRQRLDEVLRAAGL
jgi:magnesium chelatase subunit D